MEHLIRAGHGREPSNKAKAEVTKVQGLIRRSRFAWAPARFLLAALLLVVRGRAAPGLSLVFGGFLTKRLTPPAPVAGAPVPDKSAPGGGIVPAATGAKGAYVARLSAPPSPVASLGDVLTF